MHAVLALPNMTLLEAPWVNRDGETDVVWSYPEVVEGYALPLEGPGLGHWKKQAPGPNNGQRVARQIGSPRFPRRKFP
jgi:hypothetical protein